MRDVFGGLRRILVPLIAILIVLISASGGLAAQPTISITQTLPAATYVNDPDGQAYQVVLKNESIHRANQVTVVLEVHNTENGQPNAYFAYISDSIQVVLHDASAGTDSPVDAFLTGTVSGSALTGPFTVNFAEPVQLDPNDTLTLTYKLITDPHLAGGDLNVAQVRVTADDDEGAEYSFEDEEIVRVKAGKLKVKLTPVTPLPLEAHRSEMITLDATITNEGEGVYFFHPDERFAVSWGTGFAQPELVSVPGYDTPALQGNSYLLPLTQLTPDQSHTFRFTLKVEGYQDFGLDAAYENTVTHERVTDSEVFLFLINQPDIVVNVLKQAHLQYGTGDQLFADTMSVRIVNHSTQFGTARNFKLRTNFDPHLVSISLPVEMQDDWSFDPPTGTFTYRGNSGVIAELQSVDLTFLVTPQLTADGEKCNVHNAINSNTSKTYLLMLTPEYTNDMERVFLTRFVKTEYFVEQIPTMQLTNHIECELSSDGDNHRIFLNESIKFTFTVQTTSLDKWDPSEEIVLTTNLSNEFNFNSLNATSGISPVAVPRVDGSHDITWRMTPAEARAGQTLTIYVTATDNPAKAGRSIYNMAVVKGKTIVGCELRNEADTVLYLQSREEETRFLYESKNIVNLPAEGQFDVCGKDGKNQIDYELHYEFHPTSSGTWTGSTYTDKLDRAQTYQVDTAQFRIVHGGPWTPVPAGWIVSTSPLTIDLSFIKDQYGGDDRVKGRTLDLRYTLVLSDATHLSTEASHAAVFVSQSDMVVANAIGGHEIGGKHHFYQGVFVPVSRARMDVNLTIPVNETVAKGEPFQATIALTKIAPWDDNQVTVIVDLDGNYAYMGNPVYTGFYGLIPVVTLEDVDLDGYAEVKFAFPHPFEVSETGMVGTIRFDAVKTHIPQTIMKATLQYRDDLEANYSTTDQERSLYLLEGNLDLVVIPPVVDLSTHTVKWTYDIVNLGSGTAYNTHVKATLKNVLSYVSSTVNGVLTDPVSTMGADGNTLDWDLGHLQPGQSKRIEITANTSGSSADFTLASVAHANYGWYDIDAHFTECQKVNGNSGADFPSFRKPVSAAFVTNDNVAAINLEENGVLRLRVENTGKTDNYNVVVRQILGNSFTYLPGTAQILGTPIGNPQIEITGNGTELIWSNLNLARLAVMHPQETFVIEYGVKTKEAFAVNNTVKSSLTWQKPWERGGADRTGSYTGMNYAVPRKLPHITVAVDGRNETLGHENYVENVVISAIDTEVLWRIRITNSGQAPAYAMKLNHILPPGMSFVSITDSALFTDTENKETWNIGTLASGSTKTYYVRAVFDGPCRENVTDRAHVSWGSETGTLTAPGTVQDTATLVSQPVIENLSQTIADFTTRGGIVTITLEHTGAPLFNLEVRQNLSNRFELKDSITYSQGLLDGILTLAPAPGQDGDAPLVWKWTGPISAGTHTIRFEIQEANGAAGNGSPITADLDVFYKNAGSDSLNTDRTDQCDPRKGELSVSFAGATSGIQLKDAGENIQWEMIIANTGDADAINVKVVDVLGDGYTYLNSTPYPMVKVGDDYTWTIPSIPAQSQVSIFVNATVAGDGSHVKTVTATEYSEAGTVISQSMSKAFTTVFNMSILGDANTGNPNDTVADAFGELVQYTITANFIGEDSYKSVSIADTLPNGLQYVDQLLPPGVTSRHSGKNLIWDIVNFGGPQSYVITYRARIVKETGIVNNSTITNKANTAFTVHTGFGALPFTKASYPALEATNASVTVHEPALTVQSRSSTPAADSSVTAGQEINHTIVVRNANLAPAYLVKVQDVLPAGTRGFDPRTTVAVTKGGVSVNPADYTVTYDLATGKLIWTFDPDLLNGTTSYTITYKSKIDADISAGRSLSFVAHVLSYASQPTGTTGVVNYSASPTRSASFQTTDSTATITRLAPADARLAPGNTVKYQVEFTVPNGTSVYDISLESILPPGMIYVADSVVGPGVGTGGPDLGTPQPVITGTAATGQRLTWFGKPTDDIINMTGSPVTYRIEFDALLVSLPEVVRGGTLSTNTIYNFNSTNGDNATRTNHPAASNTMTVIEPALTASKTVTSAGPYMAGDRVTYRVSVSHTAGSDAKAYKLIWKETLPEGLSYDSFTPVTGNPGNIVVNGQEITWGSNGATELALGGKIEFDIHATIETAAEPDQLLNSTSDLQWSSASGLSPAERIYPATASASITVNDATQISKMLLNPPAYYVVGDTYTYRLTVTVNEGTTDELKITDTLPEGLTYVSGSISKGANIVHGPLSQPAGGSTGALVWDFGTVTNADNGLDDDRIIIEYTVQIANDPVNQAGVTHVSQGSAQYKNASNHPKTKTTDAVSIVIREPQLTILKEQRNLTKGDADFTNAAAPDAGDRLEYRITISNAAGNLVTAYDLNLIDTLTPGLRYVAGTGVMSYEGSDTPQTPDLSGTGEVGAPQVITWGRSQSIPQTIHLPAGKTIVYTYQAEVMDFIGNGGTVGGSASVDWTSMSGNQPMERNGSGGVNDYLAGASTSVQTPDTNSIQIERTTDTFNPDTADLRMGDVVTYTLTLTMQEGTTKNLMVTSVLPVGMEFVDTVSINGDSSAPYSAFAGWSYGDIPAANTPVAGERNLTWGLGSITNAGDNNPANNTFVIVHRAKVTGLNPQPSSQIITVQANLTYDGKTTPAATSQVTTAAEVKQPQLAITKTADPAAGSNIMADQLVTYTVTVTNTGTAPAYDLQLLDVIPSGMRERGLNEIMVKSIKLNHVAKAVKQPVANPDFLTNGEAMWDLDDDATPDTYTILPGESLVLVYSVRADSTLLPEQTVNNTVGVQRYASLDDDALPQGAGLADRKLYGPLTPVTVSHHTISRPGVAKNSGPATAKIGEEIIYQIKIPGDGSVVAATMYDLEATVQIPEQLEFVGAAFAPANKAEGTLTAQIVGNTLTLGGLDILPANEQCIINLTMRVKNIAANQAGAQWSLASSYRYELIDEGTDHFPGGSGVSNPLTVIEPQLTVTKQGRNVTRGDLGFEQITTPDTGDILEFRVTVENILTASAYDLNLTGLLSEGLRYVNGSFVQTYDGSSMPVTPDLTGTGLPGSAQRMLLGRDQVIPGTIEIAPGKTMTLTYRVEILDTVAVGQSLTAAVEADWTSLNGDAVGERNGMGGINDYRASDTVIVESADANTLALSRTADTFNPAAPDVRVGDIVTFEVTLGLQEGTTPNLAVTATLPEGMEFVDTVRIHTDSTVPYTSDGVFQYAPIPAQNTPAAGSRNLVWNLGNIVNTGDNLENDTFTIVYRAKVTGITPTPLAQVLEASANFSYTGKTAAAAATEVSAPVHVKQPLLTLTKAADPVNGANIMADQRVQYTLTVTNIGVAPAYDVQILDIIPAGMRARGLDGITVESIRINGVAKPVKQPQANGSFAADGRLLWNLDDAVKADTYTILPNEALELVYSLRADHDLAAGRTVSNQARVEQYASIDDDQLPAGTVLADLARYAPSAEAAVSHNTIVTPGQPTIVVPVGGVVVGETVTIQVKLPGDGKTVATDMYDLQVQVTLPDHLQLMNVSYGAGNQAQGDLITNLAGNILTVAGLDRILAEGQAVLQVTCMVKNSVQNQSGTGFDITASYTYELADGDHDQFAGGTQTGTLTVIEPSVTIKAEVKNMTKGDGQYTVNPTRPDAGDLLEYRVTLRGGNESYAATAYDLRLVNRLSEGLQYVAGTLMEGAISVTPELAGNGNTGTPQTIRWGRESGIPVNISLMPGEVRTYTYQVRVLDSVAIVQELSNTVEVDWTSISGSAAGERDGSGGLNDYMATDRVAVTTSDTNSLSLTRTSDTFHADQNDVRVGDIVTYTLTLGLQEGKTPGLTVTATLPTGLEFLDTVSIHGDTAAPFASSGVFGYPDIPEQNTPVAGAHDLLWTLGDLINTGDNLNNDTMTIVFRAKVTNALNPEPVTQAPEVRANLAYVGKTTPGEATQVSSTLDVKQPQLTISQTAVPAANSNIMAGQEVHYTLAVTNTGTAPAYDLQILDTVPAGMRKGGLNGIVVDAIRVGGQNQPVKTAEPNAGFANDGKVLWNLDNGNTADTYTILPGESLELAYHLRVDSDLTPGAPILHTAVVQTYFSLDDDLLPAGAVLTDRAVYSPSAPATLSHQTIATPGILSITGPAQATIGDEITYQIRIPGEGVVDTTLYDLKAIVVLPAQVEFLGAAFAQNNQAHGVLVQTLDGAALTLTGLERIPPKERAVIDLKVRIKDLELTKAGTGFTVSASYQYELDDGGTDGFFGGTAVSNSITVAEPMLTITKTGQSFAKVGEPIAYTLRITNAGTSTAWQTTVTDTLPAEMRNTAPVITQVTVGDPVRTLREADPDDYDVTYEPATGKWTVVFKSGAGAIVPGEVLTIGYQTQLNPQDYANISISNQACVEQYFSQDTRNGLPPDTRVYNTPGEGQSAAASITIQSPLVTAAVFADRTIAHPGDLLHYRAVLTNVGNMDAGDVTLTVDMAAEFQPGTMRGITVTSGTLTEEAAQGGANGTGTFTVGQIVIPQGGGTVTVEWDIQLRPVLVDGTIIRQQAQLDVPALIQDVTFSAQEVTVDSAPVLSLEKSDRIAEQILRPGGRLTYSLRIANTGNENAVNVVVTDQIPSNTVYVPGSTTRNGQPVAEDNGFPFTAGFSVGRVEVGQIVTLEFTVQVPEDVTLGTVISNQAVLTAEGEGTADGRRVIEVWSDDPETSVKNEPTRTVVGGFPILDARKIVTDDNGGELERGDTLTYTIDISNLGSADATQVRLRDAIPEETTYIEGTLRIDEGTTTLSRLHSRGTRAEGTINGRDIYIDLGTIVPGQTVTITFQVVLDTAQDGQVVISQGTVSSAELPDEKTDADGIDANGDQPTEIVVGAAAVLRSTMQAIDLNGDIIRAGEMVEYNITLRNIGTLEATGIQMKTQLPDTLTYVPDSTTLNGVRLTDQAGPISVLETGLSVGRLGMGEAATIRFRVTVAPDVAPGSVIDLQAVFTADKNLSGVTDSDLDDGIDNTLSPYVQAHPGLYAGINVNNSNANLNDDDPTRIQVGSNPGTANVSGIVWIDVDHDDQHDPGEALCAGWTVEVYQKDTLIDTTTTDANGFYKFRGLTPGSGYKLHFLRSAEMVSGAITGIDILSGLTDNTENYPFEPTGVVYNAVTRGPVSGAVITVAGPQGFDPVRHLLAGQQHQMTGEDGTYKLDLTADAPAGEYRITVTPPQTYSPGFPSTMITPREGRLEIDPAGVTAGSYPVAESHQPPVPGGDTTYYLAFRYTSGDAVIVNNHIPLDPILADSILLTKEANKNTVAIGEFVQYTVTIDNKIASVITPFTVVDDLPAGFKYVAGSARINGVAAEPEGQNQLRWQNLTLGPNGKTTITYTLVVGTGVSEGKTYRNRVLAVHQLTGTIISNEAVADVQVVAEPLFANTLVIGKVFHDLNGDGMQQDGEPGIPNVRIITLAGQIITTDAYGRFHLVDPQDGTFTRGNSLVLKVDPTSLPANAEFITVNPVYLRLTGVVQRVNFGVKIPQAK